MRYTVGAAGANFEIVIHHDLLPLLTDVFTDPRLTEDDWRSLCKSLVLITHDEAHRTRRAWAATKPLGHGQFLIWLSPDLGRRGPNFFKSALAHECGHVATWDDADDELTAELKADAWAAARGFSYVSGFELLLQENSHG